MNGAHCLRGFTRPRSPRRASLHCPSTPPRPPSPKRQGQPYPLSLSRARSDRQVPALAPLAHHAAWPPLHGHRDPAARIQLSCAPCAGSVASCTKRKKLQPKNLSAPCPLREQVSERSQIAQRAPIPVGVDRPGVVFGCVQDLAHAVLEVGERGLVPVVSQISAAAHQRSSPSELW